MKTNIDLFVEVIKEYYKGTTIQYNTPDEWCDIKPNAIVIWNPSQIQYRIKPVVEPTPENYKQVKFKFKNNPNIFLSQHAYLSLKDFYNSCMYIPSTLEWAVLI